MRRLLLFHNEMIMHHFFDIIRRTISIAVFLIMRDEYEGSDVAQIILIKNNLVNALLDLCIII
jgi:hypothetical protein